MRFWRIIDEKIHDFGETPLVGWDINDPEALCAPEEYIKKEKFLIMRTCHGFGDWGILTVMPYLLKQKYPNCKVYLPSSRLIKKIFDENLLNQWNRWDHPEKIVYLAFANNPYIDGYVDNYAGEIYHDHFRIYDSNNYNIPLVEQMLMFLGFTKEELKNEDTSPMLFFTDTEIEQGENIIKEYFGNEEFCSINLSRRLNLNESNFNKLNNILTRYKQYKFLYQLSISDKGLLDNVDKGLNLWDIEDSRIKLYLRSRAKMTVGYHSGVIDCVCRYSDVYEIPSPGEFKDGNFQRKINYL